MYQGVLRSLGIIIVYLGLFWTIGECQGVLMCIRVYQVLLGIRRVRAQEDQGLEVLGIRDYGVLGSIRDCQGLGCIRDYGLGGLGIRGFRDQRSGVLWCIMDYLGLLRTTMGYCGLLGTIMDYYGLLGCNRVYQGLLTVLRVLGLFYTSMGIRGYYGLLGIIRGYP